MTAFALHHNPLAKIILSEVPDRCTFVRTKLNTSRFVFSNGYGAHVHRNNRHSLQYHMEVTYKREPVANPPASRNILRNMSQCEIIGVLMQIAALP